VTDYHCPDEIRCLFATETLAASRGRIVYLAWMKSLPLIIGDEGEVLNVGDEPSVWYVYDPETFLQ